MKILEYDKDKGILELTIEVPEDLYYISLLLDKGDLAYAWTTRQLKFEGKGGESRKGDRVKVYLGIRVEAIEYHRFTKRVRVRGVIIEAPERIHSKGSYHTLSIGVGSHIRIIKNNITLYHEKILKMASSRIKKILLLSVGDDEIAIGILRPQGIEILTSWPIAPLKTDKTHSIVEMYMKPLKETLRNISEYLKREKVEVLILASINLLMNIAKSLLSEELPSNIKLITISVSEGGVSGIYEVLRRNDLRYLFSEVRGLYERELVESIFIDISKGDEKIAIGLEEVSSASRIGSISHVVLIDELLFDPKVRDEVIRILERTMSTRGEITIIPRETEHGLKLEKIGGIVARLYFPTKLRKQIS